MEDIPTLKNGHLHMNGRFYRVVKGSIKSFMDAHGNEINDTNIDSLTKRIMSSLSNALYCEQRDKRMYKHGGGDMTMEWMNEYQHIRQFGV